MKQLSEKEAIKMADLDITKGWSSKDIVRGQLYQDRLFMPFERFQAAIETVLDRGVWSHEFAYPDNLRREYEGDKPSPSFQEILNLIPEDKRIIIFDV
jgi:hypothetical protein